MSKISLNDRIFIAGASGMAGNAIKKTLLKKGYGRKRVDYYLHPQEKN